MDPIVCSFLQHLSVEKGFSPNTSDAYRNDLGQFWTFLQNQTNDGSHRIGSRGSSHPEPSKGSFTWASVDTNVLNKYGQNLRVAKKYRDATTARKVASVKTFFGFMSERNIITEDPTEHQHHQRVRRSTRGR